MMGEGQGQSDGGWYKKSPSENMPMIRHELLAERAQSGMTSAVEQQQIKHFVGTEISLPQSWKPSTSDRNTMKMTTFKCPTDSASLSLFDRGAPINAQSANDFHKLLDDNANLVRAKELSPTEIRKLSQVLGTTTAGDNQYVNTAKPPDSQSPAFHMFSAQLIPLNGKTVLEVQGNFVNQAGEKGKEFRGVFVPDASGGNRINEFFLQADNAIDVAKHLKDYKASLQSIKW